MSSFVIASPDVLATASQDLAGIGSAIEVGQFRGRAVDDVGGGRGLDEVSRGSRSSGITARNFRRSARKWRSITSSLCRP